MTRHRRRHAGSNTTTSWVAIFAYGAALAALLFFGARARSEAAGCMGELLGPPVDSQDAATTPPEGTEERESPPPGEDSKRRGPRFRP